MKIRSFLATVLCLLFVAATTNYAQTGSALTLSEVMFYPSETNGEYIEIYNTSTTETIDLSTIKFKYSTSSNNSFVAFIGGTNLAPGKYAVVLQGNYDYNNGAYKNSIPADAIVLKLATNNFGSAGMANTTSRDVYLVNGSGVTIDSYTYTADNNAGISDEKFLMTKDNAAANWRNTIKLNGTPGKRNSVTPVKYLNDLSIRVASIIPANPVEGDSVQVKYIVKNIGVYDAGAFSSELFIDQNADSIGQVGERFFSKSYSELFVADSVFVTSKFYADKPGKISIVSNVNYTADENIADNKLVVEVTVLEKPVQYTDVVVNEIMYAPTNEEPEWIELYNKSSRKVNIKNWKISDNSTIATITTSDYYLSPGDYVVVSSDATITGFYPYALKLIVKGLPSFGNSGDDVILKSNINTTVDSVKYMSTWGGNSGGYSLERISVNGSSNDPFNWKTSSSKHKATPSNINSTAAKENDLQVRSFGISSSYAEVGKDIQFSTVVANIGKTTAATFTVKLFRDKNLDGIEDISEQIAELSGSNLAANATASFSFSSNNFQAGLNQFIIRVDYTGDEFIENNSSLIKVNGIILNEVKGDLVINEIMYRPLTNESDWLEIYNNSQKSINLRGYQIGNGTSKNKILSKDLILNPSEYFVVVRDSSKYIGFTKPAKWVMATFPTLADTKSKVVILDSLNRSIDSLEYKSLWGGSSGKSLERYDPAKTSTDSTNWKTSTSKHGGTPGGINSITQKNYDLYVKNFSMTTSYAEVGRDITLSTVITNNGKSTAQNFSVKLFKDQNLDGIEEANELITELPGTNLGSGASVNFNFSTNAIQAGQNQFIVRVDFIGDEFIENNSSLLKINGIIINIDKGDLVINEIMYSTKFVSQQWLEIYNKSQKSINLNGFQIFSGTKKNKIISKNIFINPESYLVIARDSSAFGFNPKLTAAVITDFTSLTGKVALLDSLNRSIDSLEYKSYWGGTGGKSLERFDPIKASTDSTNWKTSTSKVGATPGGINSITQKNYDLYIKSFSTSVAYAEVGKNIPFTTVITNNGKSLAQNYSVKLFRDANLNGVEEAGEQIAELPGTNLNTGTSASFNFSTNNFLVGQNQFIVRVDFSSDEFTENNSGALKLNGVLLNEVKGDLIINEFMYSSRYASQQWLEIYNKSQKTINLNGYQILSGTKKSKVISKNISISPDNYIVIAGDSSVFNYNSQLKSAVISDFTGFTGKVAILDSLNRTIDSLEYKTSWGGSSAKSLERIDQLKASTDSTNWKTSTSKYGGTPGGINSVTTKNYDLCVKTFSTLAAYAEVGKNLQLTTVITNNGKSVAQSFSVKLFKDINFNGIEETNELITELPGTNLAPGAATSFNISTNNIQAGQNQFIIRVDFISDEFNENNSSLLKINGIILNEVKGDLVINEILYSAKSVTQQWLEIYNKSQKTINLKGYQIFSNGKKNKVITGETFIKPDNYFVVARDTSVFGFNSKLTAVSISEFTTLTGKVGIQDSLNRTIDSLEYKNTWGGGVGKSLERIDPTKASTDSTNWKTTASKYGGTPGGINSISQKNYDLYVKSFSLTTPYAEVGKSASMVTVITNNGKNVVQSFSVKLYKDINSNGIEEASELITELPGANIAAGASANFSFTTNNILLGQNQFIVRVEVSNDEFTENNNSQLKVNGVVLNETKGDLVINEIMYSSKYVSQQWMEIYNKSQKTINLNGYQILSGTKKTKVVSKNISINPDNYIVIAKDSSVFNFNSKLTAAVITEFTSFSGKVAILDSLNRTIDSLEYKSAWGGSGGKTLERIDPTKASTDSTNWKTSINLLGATPGLVNSLSKKNYDVALTKLLFNPSVPSNGQRIRVRVEISNIGRNETSFKLVLNKLNRDGSKTKVEETSSLSLSKDASLTYEFTYAIESLLLKTSFECAASFSLDEDISNNVVTGSITPGYAAGTVLINEVMYNPVNGEPEWIELYNTTSYDIDLEDWSISDVLTTPQKVKLTAKDYSFPKNSFLVIAKDSTVRNYHSLIQSKLIVTVFPSLNNDADGVVIKDSRGATIDSLLFDTKWGGESGKSIERKQLSSATQDKNNWASSKDIELSTPGRINSIAIKKNDLTIRAIVPSPLYPVLNEDVSVGAKVINYGTNNATSYSVKFYSKENNIYTLLTEVSASNLKANDSVVVYSNKKVKLVSTKTFMCKVVYTSDEDTLNNFYTGDVIPGSKPNSVLITEIMYAPLTGEPEWVEFVNASNEAINLKSWAISDLLPIPTKAVLTTKDEFLQPGEYAVATPDTQAYAFNPPKKFYQAKFGSLGNTSDGVILYDFRNAVIDSLNYRASWGGGNGSSIERISLTKASIDSTNWVTSLSRNGASAGTKNSVATSVKYAKNSLIINEIMYEPEIGKAEFVELYNPSNDSVQVGGMELRIGDKIKAKLAIHNFVVPPKQYFVAASDSTFYMNYPLLKNSGQVSISPSLSLSNEGATLIVKDLYGTTLDSLGYTSAWHNKNLLVTKNKSLERINPALNAVDGSNWSTSVASEGATPGRANSIYTENLSHNSKVNISPNPFSPDNDGFEDFAIINFDLPYKLSQVRIKVFDSKGRLVRTLLENRPSGASNSVIFNGLDDEGRSLRMGIYILLIEISAEGSSSIETIKTPIVVARKLN